MKKIAFLVSGNGSNADNLIREIQKGEIKAEAALVVSNKAGVKALERAEMLGVPHRVVESGGKSREAFEAELIMLLQQNKIDLIVLAGFMRVLTENFVSHYQGRLINIHPSLLPAFPGAQGIRDAFEAKAKETGVTVHYVDEGVDSGPIILQSKVPIMPEDTLETLEARVHVAEYEAYPAALKLVLDGRVQYNS